MSSIHARGRRRAVRALTVLAGAVAVLAMGASPAAAHGIGGVGPSNYESRVLGVEPPVAGIRVEVIDAGTRLALTNTTTADVVVVGYEDEPYLRLGPDGVFENERSPTRWMNRTRFGTTEEPPADVDADAVPRWVRVSSGRTARFHWHPAHWMSPQHPQVVREEPGTQHLLAEWELIMLRGGRRIVVTGDLRWVPGPSPVPYLALAVALGGGTVLLGRTRQWRSVLAGGLAVLVVLEAAHLVGLWTAASAGVGGLLLANVYSIGGIALGLVALVMVADRTRDPYDGTPVALLAGLVLAVAGGLADLGTLSASVLPTDLAPLVARLVVAGTLGVGAGVVAVAAMHLRRPVGAERPPEGVPTPA